MHGEKAHRASSVRGCSSRRKRKRQRQLAPQKIAATTSSAATLLAVMIVACLTLSDSVSGFTWKPIIAAETRTSNSHHHRKSPQPCLHQSAESSKSILDSCGTTSTSCWPAANVIVGAVATARHKDASSKDPTNKQQQQNQEEHNHIPPQSTTTSTTAFTRQRKSSSSSSSRLAATTQGLSKFHQSILTRTRSAVQKQALVTGRDAVTLSVKDSPTLKWLTGAASATNNNNNLRPSTAQLYVNGTVLEKSTASLERFLWLREGDDDGWNDDDDDDATTTTPTTSSSQDYFSLEWVAEIHLERPGYLHVLPQQVAASSLDACRNKDKPPQWSWNRNNNNNNNNRESSSKSSWQEEAANRLLLQENSSSTSTDAATMKNPTEDVLVCTGFSLSRRKGLLATLDTQEGQILRANDRTRSQLLWPNEVTAVPQHITPRVEPLTGLLTRTNQQGQSYRDALLVSDGFLVPGKDRGGLYVVQYPGNPQKEWTVRLTAALSPESWFYHKATWIDLTGDGRQSILTARCRVTTKLGRNSKGSATDNAGIVTTGIVQQGQLVWLETPRPHSYDPTTQTPLEADGTVFDPFASRHLPWKERVLATGPDVMFCIADMDQTDDCVEVIASQFFDKAVRLYSIQRGPKPRVVFRRDIDTQCGSAFASVLADLDQDRSLQGDVNGNRSTNRTTVVDSGSTVPSLAQGDAFSHLLVTSHECTYAPDAPPSSSSDDVSNDVERTAPPHLATDRSAIDGGSVFAYRVPMGRKDAWKTEPWLRTTVATGFAVRGQLGNVINPGAPGFCYTFPARKGDKTSRPLLAVAGDCAESAYVFRPTQTDDSNDADPATRYRLMVEVECESTVGSIGVGYGNFLSTSEPPESEGAYAKLYVPCYEKDKILVFALGSGDGDVDGW